MPLPLGAMVALGALVLALFGGYVVSKAPKSPQVERPVDREAP